MPSKINTATNKPCSKTEKTDNCRSASANKPINSVMIVDDSVIMRRILRNRLEEIGINNIIEAVNGQQGIKKLGKNRVEIIIADWLMPKMNGAVMITEIRKNPDYDNIPIVLVSAEYGEKIDKALKAGANGYLNKPFSANELKNLLSKFSSKI